MDMNMRDTVFDVQVCTDLANMRQQISNDIIKVWSLVRF